MSYVTVEAFNDDETWDTRKDIWTHCHLHMSTSGALCIRRDSDNRVMRIYAHGTYRAAIHSDAQTVHGSRPCRS